MAETQTEDSTLVPEIKSRISKLETSFQESIGKMMKLMQNAMEKTNCHEFDKLFSIVKGLFQNQENIKTGLEGLKAELEDYKKKPEEKKKELEENLETIEGFHKQEAGIHKRLDELKDELDSDEDDSDSSFEIDVSIEDAERELYKLFYGKYKADKKVEEGSSRNEVLFKDPKIEFSSSSSDSEVEFMYPMSDLLKKDSDREAVIEGLKQDFKKIQLAFDRGRKKDKDQSQEECSSSSRQTKEGSDVKKSASI